MLQNHGQNFHFKFNQRWENIKNHRNKDNIQMESGKNRDLVFFDY